MTGGGAVLPFLFAFGFRNGEVGGDRGWLATTGFLTWEEVMLPPTVPEGKARK